MACLRLAAILILLTGSTWPLRASAQTAAKSKPRVVVIGVNGMELDVIRLCS